MGGLSAVKGGLRGGLLDGANAAGPGTVAGDPQRVDAVYGGAESLAELIADAATGDPAAVSTLVAVATDPRGPLQNPALQREAITALGQLPNAAAMDPAHVAALEQLAGGEADPGAENAARAALQALSLAGHAEAQAALQRLDDGAPGAPGGLALLSKPLDQLTRDDVQALFDTAATDAGAAARFGEALAHPNLRDQTTQLLDAALTPTANADDARAAAQILRMTPSAVDAERQAALSRLLRSGGSAQLREAAAQALVAAGTAQPPNRAALDDVIAVARGQGGAGPAPSAEARAAAEEALIGAFAAVGASEALRAQLAPVIAESSRLSAGTFREVVPYIAAAASAGSVDAAEQLGRLLDRASELRSPAGQREVVDALGGLLSASVPGVRRAAVDALQRAYGSSDSVGSGFYGDAQRDATSHLVAAARGGDADAARALAEGFVGAGRDQRRAATSFAAELAPTLGADDPRLPHLLGVLRSTITHGWPAGNGADQPVAVAALAQMSDRLGPAERDALLTAVGQGTTGAEAAWQSAFRAAPASERARMTGAVLDGVAGDDPATVVDRTTAALGGVADLLRPEDFTRVGQLLDETLELDHRFSPPLRQIGDHTFNLMGLLRSGLESSSVDSRRIAADALSRHEVVWRNLAASARNDVVNVASASNDEALMGQVRARIPWNGVASTDIRTAVGQQYQQRLSAFLTAQQRDDPTGPFARIATLMSARALAQDERFQGHVNLEAIDRELQTLTARPDVQEQLETIRQQSIAAVPGAASAGQRQAEWMMSEAFRQRLRLLPENERAAALQSEIQSLADLAPGRVEQVLQHLQQADVAENAVARLQEMPLDDAAAATQAMFGALNLGRLSANAARELADAIRRATPGANAARAGAQAAHHLQAELARLQQAGQGATARARGLQGALDALNTLDNRGFLSLFLSGASVVGLAAHDLGTPRGMAEAASALITVGSSAEQLARLPGLRGLVQRSPRLATGLANTSRVLGPIAGLAAVGLDIWDTVEAIRRGDAGAAWGSGVSAAGGAVMMAGLIPGPQAPFVLIAGAAMVIGGQLIRLFAGNSQEENFLRDQDLWVE